MLVFSKFCIPLSLLCMIFTRVLHCFDVLTLTTTHTHTPKHEKKSVQYILFGYGTAKISSSLENADIQMKLKCRSFQALICNNYCG